MNLEHRIRQHFEETVASSQPADLSAVVSRGTRLRRRAIAGAAFLSVGAAAAVVAVTLAFSGSIPRETPVALPADESLYDQVARGWTPIPDLVDPELAEVAAELCPYDLSRMPDLPEGAVPLGDPSIRAIDQRGISARILNRVDTTDGGSGMNCGAIKVNGTWRSASDIKDELPKMVSGSGGPVPEYVAEMRLRFPDGTEVTATIGGGSYLMHYPAGLHETLAEEGSYAYMDSYSKEGALISSEMYMSYLDYEEMSNLGSSTSASDS